MTDRRAATRPLLSTVLALAVILLGAYVAYRVGSERQVRYLAARHQRAVATLAEQIKNVLENQVTIVAQLARRACQETHCFEKPIELAKFKRVFRDYAIVDVVDDAEIDCKLRQLTGGLELGLCPAEGRTAQTRNQPFSPTGSRGGHSSTYAAANLFICLDVAQFGVKTSEGVLHSRASGPSRVCTRTELDERLNPFVDATSLADVDLLLVDPDGEVQFGRTAGSVKMTRWPTREASGAAAPRPSPSPDLPQWPTLEHIREATFSTSLSVDGVDLRLLSQPIRLSLERLGEFRNLFLTSPAKDLSAPSKGKGTKVAFSADVGNDGPTRDAKVNGGSKRDRLADWTLVAVVPAEHIRAEARAVSSAMVGGVAFLLLLALVAPPVLKIWTMGPRDRLRPIDVQFLALSALMLTGLLTIGLLSAATYFALEAGLDRQLERSSESIAKSFLDRLKNVRNELDAFASHRWSSRKPEDPFLECVRADRPERSCNRVPSSCALHAVGCGSSERGARAKPSTFRPEETLPKHTQILVLAGPNGDQVEKWTVAAQVTPQVNMANFGAFADPRADRLAALDPKNPASRIALNAQASPNTGEVITSLSIASSNGSGQGQNLLGGPAIAVLAIDDIGADRAIGSGFAIVKGDGQVIHHSLPKRSVYENFLDECSSCTHLASALYAGRAEVVDAEYHGRAHRIAVAPVANTPYSVLVFREQDRLQTAALEVLAVSIGGFACEVLLLCLFATLFAGVRSRDGGSWIWPSRGHSASHVGTALSLGPLVVLSIHALIAYPSTIAVAASFAIALLALTLLFLRARQQTGRHLFFAWTVAILAVAALVVAPPAGAERIASTIALATSLAVATAWWNDRESPRGRAAYVAGFVIAGAVMAVLPAAAIFRDAFEDGMNRRAALDRHEAALPCTGYAGAKQVAAGCRSSSLTADAHRSPSPAVIRGALDDFWVAADDAAFGLFRKTALTFALPGSIAWTAGSAPRATSLVNDRLPFFSPESAHLRHLPGSAVTRLVDALGPLASIGGGLLLALAIPWAFVCVRSLSCRVVGLDEEEGPHLRFAEAPPFAGELWLAPDAKEIAELRDQERARTLHLIDMRALPDPDAVRRAVLDAPRSARVAVLHFEHRIDEPAWNAARLDLLEELLFRRWAGRCTVIVLSEIDPLSYFHGRIQSPADKATADTFLSPPEMDRWMAVVDALSKRPRGLRPGSWAPVPELSSVLAEECAWSPRLKKVEAELLAHPPSPTLERNDLINLVGDLADAHYRSLWSACTDEERVVLFNLARDGFVSPKSWRVIVRRLLERGLMRWTPALRLMNESFRRFVENQEADRIIRVWDAEEGPSLWRKLQVALVATFVIGGFVLYLTRPDQLTGTVAFLTAIGGGAATLVQLVGFLRASRGGSENRPAGS